MFPRSGLTFVQNKKAIDFKDCFLVQSVPNIILIGLK